MDFKIMSQIRDNYVYISVSGKQSPRANIKVAETAIKECVAASMDRVLVDLQGFTGETGTMDDYHLAKLLEAWSTREVIKKAALVERAEMLESVLFFETALQNRGMNVKAFKDIELAVEWIAEK